MAGIFPTDTTNFQQNLDNLQSSALNSILGSSKSTVKGATAIPWQNVSSRFFNYVSIMPERWNQLFPYRLIVIDAKQGNKIVNGNSNTTITVQGGTDNAIVNFERLGQQWIFTLPISPQQLTITDQFAINTTATLRGIVEEHSGVRFKMINASGTMGVWPYRQSITTPPTSPSIVQSIFGGAIEAFGNVVSQIQGVINTATTGHPANKPTSKPPETSAQGLTSTGYYLAMALQQFLEQYAEAKKDPKNAGWRLVFDIPKQNQSFMVTPMQFAWQQSQNKPLEILYNMQLKAWRRVDLKAQISPTTPNLNPITPGLLQRILNTITQARRATAAAVDLIGAVRSDVEKPLDVLRQTSLLVKDLAGAVVTAADLPFQLQKDYASSIKDSLNIIQDSVKTTSSDPAVRSALSAVVASKASVEGLSLSAVSGGQLGSSAASAQSIDPANNVFANPERNFDLMQNVPVFSLSLNNAQQNAVDKVLEDARATTVADLKSYRATIQELALQLSNNFGAGNAFYSKVYNRPTPNARIQPMTVDEYEILKNLYDVMQSYDLLTATTDIDDANKQSNMEYVAGLADLSGIPFNLTDSKILVPVPFGLTIEAIAQRYLGDAQRWLEIVTLNNLRDPYIDENGFQRPLLSNASGRQITISSVENLYVSQRVVLRSSTQSPSARVILDIDRLSDTSFLITLDGVANLDNFIVNDSAYLQAYLPGTVNSQQKIFIPSDLPVPNDPSIILPSSASGDPLSGLSKVDWLLTDTGDIAVNSYGDFRLSYGMTNIIQALKIKLGTKKGSMITHPQFGLSLRPGMMASEVNVQEIYNTINVMIQEDPRFQSLANLQIILNGPTLTINMGVNLAGIQGVFPLTFQLSA